MHCFVGAVSFTTPSSLKPDSGEESPEKRLCMSRASSLHNSQPGRRTTNRTVPGDPGDFRRSESFEDEPEGRPVLGSTLGIGVSSSDEISEDRERDGT